MPRWINEKKKKKFKCQSSSEIVSTSQRNSSVRWIFVSLRLVWSDEWFMRRADYNFVEVSRFTSSRLPLLFNSTSCNKLISSEGLSNSIKVKSCDKYVCLRNKLTFHPQKRAASRGEDKQWRAKKLRRKIGIFHINALSKATRFIAPTPAAVRKLLNL